MRSRALLGVLAAALVFAAAVPAGPVGGSVGREQKIEPGQAVQIEGTFRPNERACVLCVGDHDPEQPLAIYVRDDRGRVVAQDESDVDFCAVTWYPARPARYTIEVVNRGHIWNRVWIAVK